ncbi:MAG: hypothetical protein U5R48_01645 [Gammaproteobacteria bacterium]|nr:hypothetical protein [Gammaproteobacteria bacterium]
MPDPTEHSDPTRLTRLPRREVADVDVEQAPMAGLSRLAAVRFADGVTFPIPGGNGLRSAGDFAEVRALLTGWPRDLARRIRERIGPGDPEARLAEIDELLDAIALDAEAVELAWAREDA